MLPLNHVNSRKANKIKIDIIGGASITNVQDYLNHSGSTGFSTGGILSDGGSGTVDFTAGTGFIRATDNDTAPLLSFDFAAETGLAIPTDTTRYIYIDYNNGSPQSVISSNEFDEDNTKIKIGVASNEGGTLHIFNLGVRLEESIGQAGRFLRRVHGITRDIRRGGLIFGETGTRNITLTTGHLWWGRTDYTISALDTSISGSVDFYYRASPSGFTKISAQTDWDNLNWDDGTGTLNDLGNNKWGVLWAYIEPDDEVSFVYGRAEHNTQASAEMQSIPSTLPAHLQDTAVLAARFVFQQNAGSASISSAFDVVFTSAGVTAHSDLSTLAWTSALHTGTVDTFAGFDGSGAATEYTEANYLLAAGSRALTGSWHAGAFNITADQIGLDDDDNSHHLLLSNINTQSSDLTLSIDTSDASRTLTITGDPTIADWFDQSVKSGSSPTFDATNITGVPAASILAGTFGTGAYVFNSGVTDAIALEVKGVNHTIRITDTKSGTWANDEGLGAYEFFTTDGSSNGPMVIGNIQMRIHTGRLGTTPRADMIFGVGDPATDVAPVEVFRITEENKFMIINGLDPATILQVGGGTTVHTMYDSANNEGLAVLPNVNRSMVSSEGNTEGIFLAIDAGATASQRILGFVSDDQEGFIRLYNDAGGVRVNFLTFDMSNADGDVAVGGDLGVGSAPITTVSLTDLLPTLTFSDTATEVLADQVLGRIDFRSNDIAAGPPTDDIIARIEVRSQGAISSSNWESNLVFYTSDASTMTEAMRINKLGHVGFDETNPLQALHQTTTSAGSTRHRFENSNGFIDIGVAGTETFTIWDGSGNSQFTVDAGVTTVGTVDSTSGLIRLFANGTGSNTGGRLQFDTAVDFDTTIQSFTIQAFQDDLFIGPNTDIDALEFDGGTGIWRFNNPNGIITAGKVSVTGTINTVRQLKNLGSGDTSFVITSNVVVLTGFGATNTIATITGGQSGQLLTIIFTDGLVTLTDDDSHASNTLDLTGDIVSADDTVVQLVFDGTSWYQVSAVSTN